MLGSLQPLTPDVAEDVEDLQAVEAMTVHGALGSGIVLNPLVIEPFWDYFYF